MIKLVAFLQSFFTSRVRSDRGATMVEYALMVALIAVVALLAVTALGVNVRDRFQEIADALL